MLLAKIKKKGKSYKIYIDASAAKFDLIPLTFVIQFCESYDFNVPLVMFSISYICFFYCFLNTFTT